MLICLSVHASEYALRIIELQQDNAKDPLQVSGTGLVVSSQKMQGVC